MSANTAATAAANRWRSPQTNLRAWADCKATGMIVRRHLPSRAPESSHGEALGCTSPKLSLIPGYRAANTLNDVWANCFEPFATPAITADRQFDALCAVAGASLIWDPVRRHPRRIRLSDCETRPRRYAAAKFYRQRLLRFSFFEFITYKYIYSINPMYYRVKLLRSTDAVERNRPMSKFAQTQRW